MRTTASAPAASAQRSTVPALPGRVRARGRPRAGAGAASSASSGRSTKRQTPMSPCGLTVCAMSASVCAVGEMDARARLPRPVDDLRVAVGGLGRREELEQHGAGRHAGRCRCDGLPYGLRALGEETAVLGAEVAPYQPPRRGDACGARGDQVGGAHGRRLTSWFVPCTAADPQARCLRVRRRVLRHAPGVLQAAFGALTSLGRAFCATSTRAVKAPASLTARSARILRSTSMLAAFRPWMKRL